MNMQSEEQPVPSPQELYLTNLRETGQVKPEEIPHVQRMVAAADYFKQTLRSAKPDSPEIQIATETCFGLFAVEGLKMAQNNIQEPRSIELTHLALAFKPHE